MGESREHCTRRKDGRSAEEALPGVPTPRGLSDEVTAVNSAAWRVPPDAGERHLHVRGSTTRSLPLLSFHRSLLLRHQHNFPLPEVTLASAVCPLLSLPFRVTSALLSQLWARAFEHRRRSHSRTSGSAAEEGPKLLAHPGPRPSTALAVPVPALPREALQAEAALARKRGKRERVSFPTPPV